MSEVHISNSVHISQKCENAFLRVFVLQRKSLRRPVCLLRPHRTFLLKSQFENLAFRIFL